MKMAPSSGTSSMALAAIRVFSSRFCVLFTTSGSNVIDGTWRAPPCTRLNKPWDSRATRSLRIVSVEVLSSVAALATSMRPRVRTVLRSS
jgi:hypothetical protein